MTNIICSNKQCEYNENGYGSNSGGYCSKEVLVINSMGSCVYNNQIQRELLEKKVNEQITLLDLSSSCKLSNTIKQKGYCPLEMKNKGNNERTTVCLNPDISDCDKCNDKDIYLDKEIKESISNTNSSCNKDKF